MTTTNSNVTNLQSSTTGNTNNIDAILNNYGSKNLVQFELSTMKANNQGGTWSNENEYSYNGIRYTIDNSAKTITLDGASSSEQLFVFSCPQLVKNNTYIISSSVNKNFGQNVSLIVVAIRQNVWIRYIAELYSNINELEFTPLYDDYDEIRICIQIKPAAGTIINTIYKPMIRDARITDSTYQPYAMTNRELTKYTSITQDMYIGASGHETSVRFLRNGHIGMYIFNGAYYGYTTPTDISNKYYENQRGLLIGGPGTERWPIHIESPDGNNNIYYHKQGGEVMVPKDGTYGVYGIYVFFIII